MKDLNKVFPEAVNYSRIDGEAFVNYVEANSQVGRAQVLSVLSAVEEQLVIFLSQGHSVEIPWLGTLSLSVDGRAERDENGHWRLKDERLGKVMLKPSTTLLSHLKDTKFELIDGMAREDGELPADEALSVVRSLCEKDGFFTLLSYRQATGNSPYYAKKTINRLRDSGLVSEHRNGRIYIYRLK